jgi:hypothetical protein
MLVIDFCGNDAMQYACMKWHYSKCVPRGKVIKFGCWENQQFIGVVLFGHSASPYVMKPYGLKQHQGCELVRVALNKHKTPVSKIVSIALKILRRSNPGLKLVVSFADPAQNHHGGIYQAGNWIYTGDSNPTIELYVNKRWQHMRRAWYTKTANTKRRTMPGKHRYVMPLDKTTRKRIEPLAKPYPKQNACKV